MALLTREHMAREDNISCYFTKVWKIRSKSKDGESSTWRGKRVVRGSTTDPPWNSSTYWFISFICHFEKVTWLVLANVYLILGTVCRPLMECLTTVNWALLPNKQANIRASAVYWLLPVCLLVPAKLVRCYENAKPSKKKLTARSRISFMRWNYKIAFYP